MKKKVLRLNHETLMYLQLVIIPNVLFGIEQTTTLNAVNHKYFLFANCCNEQISKISFCK